MDVDVDGEVMKYGGYKEEIMDKIATVLCWAIQRMLNEYTGAALFLLLFLSSNQIVVTRIVTGVGVVVSFSFASVGIGANANFGGVFVSVMCKYRSCNYVLVRMRLTT